MNEPTMSQFANELDCLRARDKYWQEKLSSANAAIEMKNEALKNLIAHTMYCEKELDEFHGMGNDSGSGCSEQVCNAQEALSTSPESIAAWEAEKLLPLQRQVAMQADYIKESLPICDRCDEEAVGIYYYHDEDGEEWCCEDCHKAKKNFFAYGGEVDEFVVHGLEIISNTQATAEAYDREHAAKVLEEAEIVACPICCGRGTTDNHVTGEVECSRCNGVGMVAELRAANKKEGE